MKTLKRQEINIPQIKDFLKSAVRRLEKAEKIVKDDEQSGFQAAYEAMIRASLGFMLSYGFRPRSTLGHHKIIIEFVGVKLGGEYVRLIKDFDRMRKKRNKAIYEPFSIISEKDASDALTTAREFIKIIASLISKIDPQLTMKF